MRHPLSELAYAASLGVGALDVATRYFADVTGTYYENEGFIGYGTEIQIGETVGGGSPDNDTFESIAYVMSITPGDMTTAVVDKTHLRSIGAHREKLAALRDSGPFVLELTWVPTHESQSLAGGGTGRWDTGGLLRVWRDREERNYKIVLSDGSPATEWPFRGVITRFQPGSISGDALVNVTVEITPLSDSTVDLP